MGKTTRTYKTPVGAIPKIVNNIEFKTLNQKIFYDIIGEDKTLATLNLFFPACFFKKFTNSSCCSTVKDIIL